MKKSIYLSSPFFSTISKVLARDKEGGSGGRERCDNRKREITLPVCAQDMTVKLPGEMMEK